MVKEAIRGVGKAINVVKDIVMSKILPILIPIVVIAVLVISFFAGAGESGAGSNYTSVEGFYGESIQEKVWWALKDAGFNDYQVAGAMGNIEQESSFNPASGSTSACIGLCQWKMEYLGGDLKSYADSKGVGWEDEDTQLEFLVAWLANTGSAVDYINRSNGPKEGMDKTYNDTFYPANSWAQFKSTGDKDADIEYCTMAYCANYERCDEGEANFSHRIEKAKEYYEKFHDKKKPVSNGAGYWWPVGGNKITKQDGIEYALGAPTSTTVWWNPGYRQWGGGTEWHKGTDIGGSGGTDYIISIGNGKVVKRTNRIDWGNGYNNDGAGLDGYGNACMVKYADNLYVIYGHMKANTVRVKNGDTVKRGQVLGVMGDSGSASGIHICFVMLKGEAIGKENTITDISKYVSPTNPRP